MNPTIETEIAVLKEQLKYVVESIDSIKENHLPHIYNRLEKLDERFGKIETRIAYYSGGIVVAMALLQFIFK